MKKVLVILISLFALTIGVNADAQHGICAGKTVNGEDYCTLDTPVSITSVAFNPSNVNLTNGKAAAYYNYRGTINGKQENLYCIDSNLTSPSGSFYKYARALNPEKYSLDGMLARMYVSLINAAVYDYNHNVCSSLDACFNKYLQAANVLMRALVTKRKYNINPKDSWGCTNLGHGEYQNVVNQLDGLPYSGTALANGYYYDIIKDWYDTAANAAGYTGQTFKIETKLDTSVEVVTETDGDNFSKIIPIKLSGLSNFMVNYQKTWKRTNPKVQVVGLECSEGLTCQIDASSGFNLNDNLLEKFPDTDSITFYVKVTGNSQTLKNNKKGTVTVKINKYHILDTDNLAILRGYSSQAQGLSEYLPGKSMHSICYQRMVALMPLTPQKVELEVDLELPSYCRTETDAYGNTSYKLGARDATVREYINGGCCKDIKISDLSSSELDLFQEKCDGEDLVDLKQECGAGTCEEYEGNLPGKNVDSYVRQMSMRTIMSKVNSWENSPYVDADTYGSQTKTNLSHWRDDLFASELENNNYCKIYTSEENHMFYPTTTTAQSGRFFVFAKDASGNYLQPYVEGSIYSTFHTAYDLWKKDYLSAIKTEKEKYTALKIAEARYDAYENIDMNTSVGSPEYKCCAECCSDCAEGVTPSAKTALYTYKGTTTANTYFKADGTNLSYTITKKEGCPDSDGNPTYTYTIDSVSVTPEGLSQDVTNTQNDYNEAKSHRTDLETKKTECQNALSRYQSSWKYILKPDLTFNYNQKYYDSTSGTIKFVPTEVKMSISKDSSDTDKYFPNVSTAINDPTSTSGSQSLVTFNQTSDSSERLGAVYGKKKTASGTYEIDVDEPFENVDTTKDYTRDYEGVKIYFRPEKAYYSLVPSGLFETSEERFKSIKLGYVFNVTITNFQGEYETWFTIAKNGHLEVEPSGSSKNDSNIQLRINKYLEDNSAEYTDGSNGIDSSKFSSKCIYCNREDIFERECKTCDDPFKPEYIYRSVNPSDIDPNDRKSTNDLGNNWSSPKGEAAERRIRTLAEQDSIYDDGSKANLEYEFDLSTKKMQEIKSANKSTNYYDFNLHCNEYGKECESDFVEQYASYTEGRSKYKYFVDGDFKVGTINSVLGGNYPDLEDCQYYGSWAERLCP